MLKVIFIIVLKLNQKFDFNLCRNEISTYISTRFKLEMVTQKVLVSQSELDISLFRCLIVTWILYKALCKLKIKLARLQWLIWKEWSHLMFTNNVEYKVSRFVVNSIFGISIIVFDSKALAKRVSNFMLVQPDVHMSIRNQSCLESGH